MRADPICYLSSGGGVGNNFRVWNLRNNAIHNLRVGSVSTIVTPFGNGVTVDNIIWGTFTTVAPALTAASPYYTFSEFKTILDIRL